MNARQQAAVERFRRYLQEREERSSSVAPLSITKFKVETSEYGSVWISAELECTTLSENSILRALDHQYWHVNVGPKGKLEVWGCPKSCEQFAGRRAFGMKFNRNCNPKYKRRPRKETQS